MCARPTDTGSRFAVAGLPADGPIALVILFGDVPLALAAIVAERAGQPDHNLPRVTAPTEPSHRRHRCDREPTRWTRYDEPRYDRGEASSDRFSNGVTVPSFTTRTVLR